MNNKRKVNKESLRVLDQESLKNVQGGDEWPNGSNYNICWTRKSHVCHTFACVNPYTR